MVWQRDIVHCMPVGKAENADVQQEPLQHRNVLHHAMATAYMQSKLRSSSMSRYRFKINSVAAATAVDHSHGSLEKRKKKKLTNFGQPTRLIRDGGPGSPEQ